MASRLPLSEMHNLAQLDSLHQAPKVKVINKLKEEEKVKDLEKERTEKKKFGDLKRLFNDVNYDTFLSIVLLGGLRGAHLIAVINSSKKLREYGNRDFYLNNQKGESVCYYDQYLFRLLLGKKGIPIPFNKTPKQTYIEKTIGGTVWGFGYSGAGQLGLSKNNQLNTIVPEKLPCINNIIQVACGSEHSVCLDNKGQVWGFGYNLCGQLGNTILSIYSPTLISQLSNIIQVACGFASTYCLDNKGRVWAFGDNQHGQLGLGNVIKYNTIVPTMIPNLDNIVQISAGHSHLLCLDDRGRVWGSGNNNYNQLGLENDTWIDQDLWSWSSPMKIPCLIDIVKISCGYNYSLCLNNKGRVYVFGKNSYGQLGLGDTRTRNTPVMIPKLKNIVHVSAGGGHSICLDTQGRVWRFGYNGEKRLGLGDNEERHFPTLKDDDLNNIIQVACGFASTYCLDNKGRVWGFGDNSQGQLGLKDTNVKNIPTLNHMLSNIIYIACGDNHSLVIRKQPC